MTTTDKIGPQHLRRTACVYVRQSTIHQVREHTASAEVQYDLVKRAVELGWAREAVQIYDADLGVTGALADHREDFSKIVTDVSMGHLGIILGFDATRLARNNSDWYRLFDLCGVCDTLIADHEGIYSPALYNDRLVLGLKGMMSEAEHHLIRTRLNAGIEKKVSTGDLRKRLPVGFDYDELGRVCLTADESVRHAIELVFRKFDQLGSAHQVYRHFQAEGLLLPARRYDEKQVRWRKPRYSAIRGFLANPRYTGAYVYGRTRQQRTADTDGRIQIRTEHLPRSEWKKVIKDHHPGYITWEQFEENQRRLSQNALVSTPGEASEVLREGHALLQGIIRCGTCGRRMSPSYPSKGDSVRYTCDRGSRNHGGTSICQSVGGKRLHDAVVPVFLEALSPASMEVTLATLDQVDQEEDAVLRQLEERREKAEYEAERARRQYDTVEPENRLVARTLEAEWNKRLTELSEIERSIDERSHQQPPPLTVAERERLLDLGLDLRKIWEAASTTSRERKQLLRAAFTDVVVRVDRECSRAIVTLLWQGGSTTELEVRLPRVGQNSRMVDESVIEDVRRMAEVMNDKQIANTLVRRGIRTPTDLSYTVEHPYQPVIFLFIDHNLS